MERGDAAPDRDRYRVDGRPAHHRNGHPGYQPEYAYEHPGHQPEYAYEYDEPPVGGPGRERYERWHSPRPDQDHQGRWKGAGAPQGNDAPLGDSTPWRDRDSPGHGVPLREVWPDPNWSDTEWAEPRPAPASRIPSRAPRPEWAPGPGGHLGNPGPRPAAGPRRPPGTAGYPRGVAGYQGDADGVGRPADANRAHYAGRPANSAGNAGARARDAWDRPTAHQSWSGAFRDRAGTAARQDRSPARGDPLSRHPSSGGALSRWPGCGGWVRADRRLPARARRGLPAWTG